MPELPEVETIRLGLVQKLINLKIQNVNVLNPKSFLGEPSHLSDKKIKNVFRKAKVLVIEVEDLTLLTHLKMSGQLIFIPNDKRSTNNDQRFAGGHPTKDMNLEMPNKSTRVIFEFNDGSKLYFNDQRKFGWIKVVNRESLVADRFLKSLGPEPLEKDFTWQVLKDRLLKRNTPVKVVLLDQSVISGVGNIYACEACFLAGIDPRKKVSSLTDREYKKLHRGIVGSLNNGIKYGGSSKTHFINPDGKKGLFLDYAFVYAREKLPCKICKTPIEKIRLGGRGTFYCPNCQR